MYMRPRFFKSIFVLRPRSRFELVLYVHFDGLMNKTNCMQSCVVAVLLQGNALEKNNASDSDKQAKCAHAVKFEPAASFSYSKHRNHCFR